MDLLEKVEKLEHEADEFGFRWETTDQIMAQIISECSEIKEHLHADMDQIDKVALKDEVGDLLHAVFSLCVFCKLNPKETLEQTIQKFQRRLQAVKKLAAEQGLTHLKGHSFEQLMIFWDEAKLLVG